MVERGPDLVGKKVLVVEGGPTLAGWGVLFGADTVAACHAAVGRIIHPPPVRGRFRSLPRSTSRWSVRSCRRWDMAAQQLVHLEATWAVPCDVVITGTPIQLSRVIDVEQPSVGGLLQLQNPLRAHPV